MPQSLASLHPSSVLVSNVFPPENITMFVVQSLSAYQELGSPVSPFVFRFFDKNAINFFSSFLSINIL
jgi:hypothetical protein